ncbi:hypothetical protein DFS34DRAFT_461207 [Phlyctochytrium arcticum]|nr:hypothetical protein DFS34DRAFT_461207 [Phlyctochytrium arcticum]
MHEEHNEKIFEDKDVPNEGFRPFHFNAYPDIVGTVAQTVRRLFIKHQGHRGRPQDSARKRAIHSEASIGSVGGIGHNPPHLDRRGKLEARQNSCGWNGNGRQFDASNTTVYQCGTRYFSSAQFNSRPANKVCTACESTNLGCLRKCCTALSTGTFCVCPADLHGPTCSWWYQFSCSSTLESPDLSSCASTSAASSLSNTASVILNDYDDTNQACPRFSTSEVVDFKFRLKCKQDGDLYVNITRQSVGGSLVYTDGLFQYQIGDKDQFAYSYFDPSRQFRVTFHNFYRLSDESQAYFSTLSDPLMLIGGADILVKANLSSISTSGYSSSRNQFVAGGRVYFEGGVYSTSNSWYPGLTKDFRYANALDFHSPLPKSFNTLPIAQTSSGLSVGAIIGIAIASLIFATTVINFTIKERRRMREKTAN